MAEPAHSLHIPAHEGKGLFVPVLSPAKLLRQNLIVTAAGQMHPTKTLDSHDAAGFQGIARQLNGVSVQLISILVQIKYPRSAIAAAVRLGVVAAVFNIAVLLFTVGAHGKLTHGGLGPVVGDVLYDGETGAAVGAVYKGVAVTPVGRVKKLSQAVGADAHIWGDKGISLILHQTFSYLKALVTHRLRKKFKLYLLYKGKSGRFFRDVRNKTLQILPAALQLHHNSGGAVLYISGKGVVPHKLVDKGAKAHSLYNAVYFYKSSFQRG